MSLFMKNDVLLDEDALKNASQSLEQLAGRIIELHNTINNMLLELHTGFQTPAGDKFIKSCQESLLKPMKNESEVIQQISANLKLANTQYRSVFEEFKALNNLLQ